MNSQININTFTKFNNNVISVTLIFHINVIVITGCIDGKYIKIFDGISTICNYVKSFRSIVTTTEKNFYYINLVICRNVVTITTMNTEKHTTPVLWNCCGCQFEICRYVFARIGNRHNDVFNKHLINFGFGVCTNLARSRLITFVIHLIAKVLLSFSIKTIGFNTRSTRRITESKSATVRFTGRVRNVKS